MADQMTPTPRVRRLSDLDLADVACSGGKAARLGHLLRAGFPVPDGLVVTAERDGLPVADAEHLLRAVEQFVDSPLAVRSSGPGEDRADCTGAGLYDTVLGVRGGPAVLSAVRRCLASARKQRVGDHGGQQAPVMTVLVQRMVDAQAAGVAFTANPTTGARDEIVVNAVRGLGDRLTSGEVSPEEWVVRGATAHRIAGPAAIDAGQAHAVAALARRVADHLGSPQDIEWAISGGVLWLLQARPISALPAPPVESVPVPVQPPPGYWTRDESHLPRPRTPMLRSVQPFNEAMRAMSEEFGFLVTVVGQEIGGWTYATVLPAIGKPGATPPPTWLLRLIIHVVPGVRRRVRRCVQAVRGGHAARIVDRWYGEWRPQLARRIETLRENDPAELDDQALEQHLNDLRQLHVETTHLHFLLFGAYMLEVGEFALTCRTLLDWNDEHTLGLLAGLSGSSTEPGRRITELAEFAAERPALRALLLNHPDVNTYQELPSIDPEFAAALDEYQHTYGLRALQYEFGEPTLAELPGLLLQLIRDQLRLITDPDERSQHLRGARAEAVADTRAALAHQPEHLAEFDRLLNRSERAYPMREDNEFFTISVPFALMRRALLTAGRRLADRGLLDAEPDIFFLEFDEARHALRNSDDVRSIARRRRGERAWIETHPGPPSYGRAPAEPPSLDAFPNEVRHAMDALAWAIERVLGQTPDGNAAPTGTLTGLPASPGRYRGPVRVIASEQEFPKLRKGDVLVCPTTSPVWSVVFPSLGALVTDSGGTLSHPAIIAREHRLPAVVATSRGTHLLRDGQFVTVDGSRGIVEIEP